MCNIQAMQTLKPGPYDYFDFPEAQAVRCEVLHDGEALVAQFPRSEEDDGAELLVADLPGHFERVR